MSLRKSPVRTPALLAANRANAGKSTGPRTPAGKRTSAWNALRHGYRSHASWAAEPDARDAEAYEAFLRCLRVALLPKQDETGERFLREKAADLWKTKRILDHWIDRHPSMFSPGVRLLPRYRTQCFSQRGSESREGWVVTVSVTARWGRSPDYLALCDMDPRDRAAWLERVRRGLRAHTVISMVCTNHPWTYAYRARLRTNPECHRKGKAWENIIEDFESDAPGQRIGPRDLGIMPAPPPRAECAGARRQRRGWWRRFRKGLRRLVSGRRFRRPPASDSITRMAYKRSRNVAENRRLAKMWCAQSAGLEVREGTLSKPKESSGSV
jgi:hypothetical protein